MMGAGEGIVTGSLILSILLFFIALFAGRIWCGWLCPMGAWQESCSPVIKRPVTAGGIKRIDIFYGTVGGISVSSLDVLQIVVMIFISILVIAFITGKRGFCHVICPLAGIMVIGRVLADRARWSSLRLSVQNDACTGCRTCQKECPMGLAVTEMVRNNQMENHDCILCARCADTCPEGVIGYSFKRK